MDNDEGYKQTRWSALKSFLPTRRYGALANAYVVDGNSFYKAGVDAPRSQQKVNEGTLQPMRIHIRPR